METHEYLSQVSRFEYLIKNKIDEIERLRTLITSITIEPKSDKVQSSGDKDKVGAFCARIVDLETEIVYLDNFRNQIIGEIEDMKNPDEYQVLYSIYVSKMGATKASQVIRCSRGKVYLLLKSGIENFEKKYGKNYLDLVKKDEME